MLKLSELYVLTVNIELFWPLRGSLQGEAQSFCGC
jgi:hypothetical protein